ncbi:uncharacterized protein LOC142333375 [Lycorma delicatula]|uniref:uncharacterized protein LOC142333375 n=1 Tax=Lycorma delicatula TaxID=130591 RepID=UPI003F51AB45
MTDNWKNWKKVDPKTNKLCITPDYVNFIIDNELMLNTLFEFSERNLDTNLQYQVDHFIHQISVSPAVFEADGFFTIGKHMIPACLDNLVTYILLALQVEKDFL